MLLLSLRVLKCCKTLLHFFVIRTDLVALEALNARQQIVLANLGFWFLLFLATRAELLLQCVVNLIRLVLIKQIPQHLHVLKLHLLVKWHLHREKVLLIRLLNLEAALLQELLFELLLLLLLQPLFLPFVFLLHVVRLLRLLAATKENGVTRTPKLTS